MSQIFPFRAFRYNSSLTEWPEVVCPPYDIISDSLAKRLRKIFSNAIHVELPEGLKAKNYGRAKKVWEEWRSKQIVQQDSTTAFYIYEQNFKLKGKKIISRKGFFCALKLEKPGAGSVLRHELTLSKPKKDRFTLLKTIKINTSPIFGLFKDDKKQIQKILNRYSETKPWANFKDRENVQHKIWICSNPKEIQIIQRGIERADVLIADGHHRYETAWNYYQATKNLKFKENGSSSVLFFLCPMESSGLVIFPTHRVLKQRTTISEMTAQLKSKGPIFKVSSARKFSLKSVGLNKNSSFAITDGKKVLNVKIRTMNNLKKFLSKKHSSAYIHLSLVHLHSFLLPEKQKEDFIYTHDQKEAVQLALKEKSLAFLVPPVTVQELYSVVRSGDLMPQKSTYFYPKVITGLVFRSLG